MQSISHTMKRTKQIGTLFLLFTIPTLVFAIVFVTYSGRTQNFVNKLTLSVFCLCRFFIVHETLLFKHKILILYVTEMFSFKLHSLAYNMYGRNDEKITHTHTRKRFTRNFFSLQNFHNFFFLSFHRLSVEREREWNKLSAR